MKIAIPATQVVHFRKNGRLRLEDVPFDPKILPHKDTLNRDLWRTSAPLKKWILQVLGPVALELTGKPRLRLACDQTISSPFPGDPLKDLFCFQGIACFFVLSKDASENFVLEVFEPSCLSSWVSPEAFFLVAFTFEQGLLIQNKNDPFTLETRNLGYVFGDHLRNELHPLIIRK